MKSRDTLRLGVLRLIKTALQNKAIEERGALSEEQESQVLKTLLKQRKESIEMFRKGGREDLASKEAAEIEVLGDFLPESVSEGDIELVVSDVALELGASSMKDMGGVMKETMARLDATGKLVDGKLVSAVVRRKLQ